MFKMMLAESNSVDTNIPILLFSETIAQILIPHPLITSELVGKSNPDLKTIPHLVCVIQMCKTKAVAGICSFTWFAPDYLLKV